MSTTILAPLWTLQPFERELWALRIQLRVLSGQEVFEEKLRQILPRR